MGINFTHPWALLALLLPVAWWVWRHRRQALRTKPGPFEWLRLLVVLLLVLALSGVSVIFPARHQAVIFLADLSVSTATVRPQMVDFIRSSLRAMPAGDLAGVLAMGEDAQLETPISGRPTFNDFTAVIRPDYTDLERGLRLGAALLPSGYQRRVVLLSDGKENVGAALPEVERLRERGFTVDIVDVAPAPGAEALIKAVEGPSFLQLGERMDATITINATTAGNAQLRIYEERRLVETRTLLLQPGDQLVRVTMEGLTPGYHRVWAVLEADKDTQTQNNEASLMVDVQGAPSIMLVEGYAGAGTNLRRALEATGMAVEVRSPDALPTYGTQLARYASVLLVDVPVPTIPAQSLDAMSAFVKQSGHGLVVVGGEHSYAMGGYAGTKLEELLPVTMEVPQRKEQPPVAVALIIESFESQQKVNMSKEAGKALVDLLTPKDTIVVSDANFQAGWVVSPTKVTDKAKIKGQIDQMSPGDPPEYITLLEAAAAELRKVDAKVKHIVLAGDGDAAGVSNAEYASRIARLADEGITISTVHVNMMQASEQAMMTMIAQQGKGRYYLASDPSTTPAIFLKEAQVIARPSIVEMDFVPTVVSKSQVLQSIDTLPMLRGYIGTTPKPTGEVVLQSSQADPILATWQAGLGRVAAFTSDTGGLWSGQWVAWNKFAQFWSNLVSWSMPSVDSSGLRVTSTVVGGKARLTVQVLGNGITVEGDAAAPTWPATLTAGIIRPDGTTQVLPLQGVGPGQYEGEFPAPQAGPYLVKLSAGSKRQSVQLGESFVLVPYSPEFAGSGSDPVFLQQIAQAGGGTALSTPDAAFARNLPRSPGRLPLDQALLVAALLLWPVDIALRRLALSRADMAAWLRRRRTVVTAPPSTASPALERLRVRRATPGVPLTDAAASPPPAKAATLNDQSARLEQTPEPSEKPVPPASATPQTDHSPSSAGNFAEQLLSKRRNRK